VSAPELEHVPTVPELARMGLAEQRPTKQAANTYLVSAAGHKLMGEVMRRNGLALRAHDEQRRAEQLWVR
jgi:hypothetical protein